MNPGGSRFLWSVGKQCYVPKDNLNGLLCLRLLGFWILSIVCYYTQQISKTGSVFIFLQESNLSPCVLFIILDNGQSNPLDLFID